MTGPTAVGAGQLPAVPVLVLTRLLEGWRRAQREDVYTAETSDGATARDAADRVAVREALIDDLARVVYTAQAGEGMS